MLPAVTAMLSGEETTLSHGLIEKIGALLEDLEAQAGPEIRFVIKKVKCGIRQKTVFKQMGLVILE